MESHIEQRLHGLRNELTVTQTDTLIIFSDENRRYLSGFTGVDGGYDESAGVLIITLDHLLLATDSRFETQAAQEAEGYEIYCYKKGLAVELPGLLEKLGSKVIGVESARLTHALYDKMIKETQQAGLECRFESQDDILKHIRTQKDDDEIKIMKKALAIAETSFLELRTMIHPGMAEKKAAWLLEKFMRQNGADALSFPVIAASGKNSALPHAIPGDRVFLEGEPLLFDFGAKWGGYCSDTTRTLVIGAPDDTFKEAYSVLNTAQQMAIDAIVPGMKCSDIDKIAREHINQSRFKNTFGHGLGHGVGLAIHEAPRLSSMDDSLLEPGMVVTVEPGIYLPQWGGIRLENMILVTENGAEVLNTMGYDNYIIEPQ